MEISDQTLWILAVVLFFGLVVPQLFRKVQLTFTISLVLIGALIGPNGSGWIDPGDNLDLLGFLGATFHMLLAGIESETLALKSTKGNFWKSEAIAVGVPLIVGFLVTKLYGYELTTALFVGALFISSSIMTVFSVVRNAKMGTTRLGKTMKSMVVVEDLVSAFLIFVIFKYFSPPE